MLYSRPSNRRKSIARHPTRLAVIGLAVASGWGLSVAISAEKASQTLTSAILQSQSPCVQAELRKTLVDRLEPLRQSDLAVVQEVCRRSDIAKDQLMVLMHETSIGQVVE